MKNNFLINRPFYHVEIGKNQSERVVFLTVDQPLDIQIDLVGENASVDIKIIYLCQTKVNIKTQINHLANQTTSNQLIKGLSRGQTSFHGTIFIPENISQCIGNQLHQGMLLSDNAGIEAIPQLDIFSEDVSCSHGSTFGKVDEDQLFYLMARGIDFQSAKNILIKGFIENILPEDGLDYLNDFLKEKAG